MTVAFASCAAQRVLPAPVPGRRTVRHAPATAMGLLMAVVLGAGVLLLPAGSPDSGDQLTTLALVQRPAHPVQPVVPPATAAPAAPAAPVVQFRDPFRPLVSDAGQQAPAAVPDSAGGAGEDATPAEVPAAPVQVPLVSVTIPPLPDISTGSPTSEGPSVVARRLALTAVETAGEGFVAVLSLDGTTMRAEVGASFGPGGELLLLSLQQGPAGGQWTAVVQRGRGEPFDVVTGTPTRLP